MSAQVPVITVGLDASTDLWTLYATSYNRTSPAGPRLFHAPPHPEIAFAHEGRAEAERDAATLREYIGRIWKDGPSKAKVRKQHD